MGWEPTKCAPQEAIGLEHNSHILPFTLPTSVTTAPFFKLGAICAAMPGMFSVGVQMTTRSASETAFSGESKTSSKIFGSIEHFFLVDSLLDHADIFSHSPRFFAANAKDAPSRPVPSMATLRNFIFF